MVEEGASEGVDGILIEGRDSISREDLLNDIETNFLLCLDSSSSFETVDPSLLIQHLETSF